MSVALMKGILSLETSNFELSLNFDTFLRLPRFDKSSVHRWLQLGHDCFFSQYRRMMDCSMDENGVTPIPVPTKTA